MTEDTSNMVWNKEESTLIAFSARYNHCLAVSSLELHAAISDTDICT